MEEGKKYDTGKTQYYLIPSTALEGLAKVLTFGASKYGANNWRYVYPSSRYYDALMRHLQAVIQGEWLDAESGLPHMDHVQCNAMFLREIWSDERKAKEKYETQNLTHTTELASVVH